MMWSFTKYMASVAAGILALWGLLAVIAASAAAIRFIYVILEG